LLLIRRRRRVEEVL
jgi:hypothetical protein